MAPMEHRGSIAQLHSEYERRIRADETVKTHVARVLGKLQVENRAQAIVQALK